MTLSRVRGDPAGDAVGIVHRSEADRRLGPGARHEPPQHVPARGSAPAAAAVSRDGTMLWVAAGRMLQGLDIASERSVGPRRLSGPVSALTFGRDGRLYAVGSSGVSALDPETGLPLAA